MNRTVIQNYKKPYCMLMASPVNQCFISMYLIFNILLSPLHLSIYLLNELPLMFFNPYVTKNI